MGEATPPPKGYVIAEIEVLDAVGFEEYRAQVAPLIAARGGRYLVRGGDIVEMEGEAPKARIVVIECPSVADAKAMLASEEYKPMLAIRHKTAKSRLYIVEGWNP
jgi:uncharacterized protein (DUF1330 family)